MHVFSVQLSAAYVFIKLDTIIVPFTDFEARVQAQDLPAFLRAGCGLTAPTFTKTCPNTILKRGSCQCDFWS